MELKEIIPLGYFLNSCHITLPSCNAADEAVDSTAAVDVNASLVIRGSEREKDDVLIVDTSGIEDASCDTQNLISCNTSRTNTSSFNYENSSTNCNTTAESSSTVRSDCVNLNAVKGLSSGTLKSVNFCEKVPQIQEDSADVSIGGMCNISSINPPGCLVDGDKFKLSSNSVLNSPTVSHERKEDCVHFENNRADIDLILETSPNDENTLSQSNSSVEGVVEKRSSGPYQRGNDNSEGCSLGATSSPSQTGTCIAHKTTDSQKVEVVHEVKHHKVKANHLAKIDSEKSPRPSCKCFASRQKDNQRDGTNCKKQSLFRLSRGEVRHMNDVKYNGLCLSALERLGAERVRGGRMVHVCCGFPVAGVQGLSQGWRTLDVCYDRPSDRGEVERLIDAVWQSSRREAGKVSRCLLTFHIFLSVGITVKPP